MRKRVPALGLLLFGLSLGFWVGSHTSTIVQSLSAQAPSPKPSIRSSGIEAPLAFPTVPDFWVHLSGDNPGDAIQQLDGMDCDGCTLKVKVLTYSGGQFKCQKCSISYEEVRLFGAAQNTLTFLQMVGAVPKPNAESPNNPNTPQIHTATLTNVARLNWVSLAK